MKHEVKYAGGSVVECKESTRNGVPIGIIEGYIATWDVDEGYLPDRFHKGCFEQSLREHRARGDRQVRFKDHHGRTVGGFPIDTMVEDDVGLKGSGEINLDTQQGREAYSLAKQGVLVDFSVGFSAHDKETIQGIREIYRATIWEGSIVDEPMNPAARVTAVKSRFERSNLDMAPADTPWDAKAAKERLMALPYGDGNAEKAFIPYGDEGLESAVIGDVVDGKLVAVPEALEEAAMLMKEHDDPNPDALRTIERYFVKMDRPSPFEGPQHLFFNVTEAKEWTRRALEKALVKTGSFTSGAAKLIASRYAEPQTKEEPVEKSKLLEAIRGTSKAIAGQRD
jgi:HK97 family phage prohead protease